MTFKLAIPAELEERLREAAHKAGATPAEFTVKLLQQHLPATDRRAELVGLLERWDLEDAAMTAADAATNAAILRAIDSDRLSHRKLFANSLE